jgi:orotate phosphoribosyltransferase-like protein
VNDEEMQGAPITTQMGENVVKIRELVQSVHRLTCKMIADELDMSKETVRKILVQDLGMRKLAVKFVPQNLMEEQKNRHPPPQEKASVPRIICHILLTWLQLTSAVSQIHECAERKAFLGH